MKQKIILLDIDGTIYDQKGHIPDSTRQAIKKAKQKGHTILLCTGRSKGEIPDEIWELDLDGMIGSAGAYILYQVKTLYHRPMEQESCDRLFSYLEERNISYVAETNEAIYGNEAGMKYVQAIIDERLKLNPKLAPDFLGKMVIIDTCRGLSGVNKVLYFDAPYQFDVLQKDLGAHYHIVPNSIIMSETSSGEVSELGMTKAKGILTFLSLTGRELSDTIAFGDGINDMEMIQTAHIGVAMGNAVEALKEVADAVTKDVADDGIYVGFEQFDLL